MVSFPFSSPFTSYTGVTKTQLDQLVAAINALPRGFIGEQSSGSTVTLATAGQNYVAPGCSVTDTIPTNDSNRRYSINVSVQYFLGSSTSARGIVYVAYNAGSSVDLTSAVFVGQAGTATNATGITGGNGGETIPAFGTVALAPGTYTFYPVVARYNGGAASDTAGFAEIHIDDDGAA